MAPRCVFENIVLWKTVRPLFPTHSVFVPPLTHALCATDYVDLWGRAKLVMNTSSVLMAWEIAGRCQAPVKRNMDFHFKQTGLLTRKGVLGKEGQGPRRGWPRYLAVASDDGQWCSTCLPWVTVIEIHLRTSIAVSASQASWQVADLQSCAMIHIGVGRGSMRRYTRNTWLCFSVGELAHSVTYMQRGMRIAAVKDWRAPRFRQQLLRQTLLAF